MCEVFQKYDIPVINADQISRDSELSKWPLILLFFDFLCHKFTFLVVDPGKPVWKKIKENFGSEVFNEDQTLNRDKLGTFHFLYFNLQLRSEFEEYLSKTSAKSRRDRAHQFDRMLKGSINISNSASRLNSQVKLYSTILKKEEFWIGSRIPSFTKQFIRKFSSIFFLGRTLWFLSCHCFLKSTPILSITFTKSSASLLSKIFKSLVSWIATIYP